LSDQELCYLGAAEALNLFKARKLSPVELMRAVIERAEVVEPTINAFPFTYFDRALEAAQKAEAKYARSDGRPRALEGIPVAIKNETAIKGEITTAGSLIFKDARDEHTSPVVERLTRAGAIIHARSAAPEFSCAAICHNRLHGVTRNPWNPDYTCGGSSGGAGAALAAGSTTLANGSDIAGSIRIPASANGVVGFKPPYGRVPEDPPFNLDFYCHAGPMARSVADCALMENVLAGPHPRDIVSLRPKLRIPAKLGNIKGWRIAYSIDLGYFEVDPQVRQNTLAALGAFREAGAEVEEVDLSWGEETFTAALNYLSHIFGAYIDQYYTRHADEMTDYARAFAEWAQESTAKKYFNTLEVAGTMYASLGPLLQKYRLLICPTLAVPAVKAEHSPIDPDFRVNGKPVDAAIGWCMTYPFNMMSRCPVLSVPSGRAANGVPTGIQIVGRSYDDVSVFRAADVLEGLRPWLDSPARRPRI
jgi:amidase